MIPKRLVVDPTTCDAFGYCAELLPELVTLDEWGFPVLAASTVPPALLEAARRAVANCPRRALRLAALPVDPPAQRSPSRTRSAVMDRRRGESLPRNSSE